MSTDEKFDSTDVKKRIVEAAAAVAALGAACVISIESKDVCPHVLALVKNGWKLSFKYTEDGFVLQGKAP